MANQFLKLRRSSVPGKKPDTGSLDYGEIALNTYDGLAFMKKSGSSGEEIVTIGSTSNSFSGSFTGSLQGTASWAQNALTSSYVESASYALTSSFAGNTISASYSATSSIADSASFTIQAANASSASYALTSSYTYNASNANSASYALNTSIAMSASFATSAANASSASFATNAANATSASYATFATTASSADNFLVRGTLTAQTIVAQIITSSTDFVTGSTRFGTLLSDTHQFTGSVSITGSLSIRNLTQNNLSQSVVVDISTGQLYYNTVVETTKSGNIAPSSFSGRIANVVFNNPFPNDNYSVSVSGGNLRVWTVTNKTANGFRVSSNSRQALTQPVLWIATMYA